MVPKEGFTPKRVLWSLTSYEQWYLKQKVKINGEF